MQHLLAAQHIRRSVATSSTSQNLASSLCFVTRQLSSSLKLSSAADDAHPSWHADSVVEQWAQEPLEVVSLQQMIAWGRTALHNPVNVLKSARHVQRELPKRLAR